MKQIAKLNLRAVVKGGLAAGAILFFVPQGIPWAGITFLLGPVMGRTLGAEGTWPPLISVILHLGLSLVYTLVIACVVKSFRSWRGILLGGAVGFGLYLLNVSFLALTMPHMVDDELRPAVSHVIFGLLAAAGYKATARPRIGEQAPQIAGQERTT